MQTTDQRYKSIKRIELQDIEGEDHGAVWVLNNAPLDISGRHRRIVITCPKLRGSGYDAVTVPNTFVPLNLTMQVTKRQLLDSSEFRRSLMHGLLILIPDEAAKKVLASPSGKAELQRLEQEDRNLRAELSGQTMQPENAGSEAHVRAAQQASEAAAAEDAEVNPAVVLIMESDEATSARAIHASLKGLATLSAVDLNYVAKIATKRKMKNLVDWAHKRLAKLKNEDDSELE